MLNGMEQSRSPLPRSGSSDEMIHRSLSELLFIRLDGTSRVLWSEQETPRMPVAAIPSPDGTHLAIAGFTRHSNAWMLTDF